MYSAVDKAIEKVYRRFPMSSELHVGNHVLVGTGSPFVHHVGGFQLRSVPLMAETSMRCARWHMRIEEVLWRKAKLKSGKLCQKTSEFRVAGHSQIIGALMRTTSDHLNETKCNSKLTVECARHCETCIRDSLVSKGVHGSLEDDR